jgi:hypothetical protein
MANIQVRQTFDMGSTSKIINLPAPGSSTEPVRLQDLDSIIAGGISWKDAVRVAVASNVNLAAPGSQLDGITLSVGDRLLLMGQTTPKSNGIYVFNGDSITTTRSTDANSVNSLEQAIVTVEEGTYTGNTYRQTNTNFVLDTDSVTWTAFMATTPSATEETAGVLEVATQSEVNTGTDDVRAITPLKLKNSVWSVKKHQTTITGNASSFPIVHNLGSNYVHTRVYTASGDEVMCNINHTDANTITLEFSAVLGANSYTVVIIG